MQGNTALAPTRTRQKTTFPSRATKWSHEEDELLIKLVTDGQKMNWNEISINFQGKTAQQISERWSKVVNPDLIKGSWTRAEDETILEFVKQYGTKNWTRLAQMLPGRIGKQCRERWRNHLDPANNRGAWTPEEDSILINLHQQFGNSWVKIASLMPGRSDNCIKNRWNSTLRKSSQQPTIQLNHNTPVTDIGQIPLPPYTPTNEGFPKPVFEENSYDNINNNYTPRQSSFDHLNSPFNLRGSPFNLNSPFFKNGSLLSPWLDNSKCTNDCSYSPRIGQMTSENREPNLQNLL